MFGEDSEKFYWETKTLELPTSSPKTEVEENNNGLITNVRKAVVDAGAITATRPTGADPIIKKAKKIEFARVVCTLGGQSRQTKARTTARPYTQVESNSVSCALGRITSPNNVEQAVREAIRVALKVSQPTARVTFKPQGYVG